VNSSPLELVMDHPILKLKPNIDNSDPSLTSDIRENERPSHETYCDLIERELQKALEDIAFIRVSEAKGRYQFF
jgi:hypothetical protein